MSTHDQIRALEPATQFARTLGMELLEARHELVRSFHSRVAQLFTRGSRSS